jgi:hypothetical protein
VNLELDQKEVELLQAIFNSNLQLPVQVAEVVVSIKAKLGVLKAS